MDVLDEPQLFGAGMGRVNGANVSMSTPNGEHGLITVSIHVVMRERPMWLTIHWMNPAQVPTIMGATVPLMTRSANMSGEHARRTMWWLHDKFGKEGFEVSLLNCPRPKRK